MLKNCSACFAHAQHPFPFGPCAVELCCIPDGLSSKTHGGHNRSHKSSSVVKEVLPCDGRRLADASEASSRQGVHGPSPYVQLSNTSLFVGDIPRVSIFRLSNTNLQRNYALGCQWYCENRSLNQRLFRGIAQLQHARPEPCLKPPCPTIERSSRVLSRAPLQRSLL